MNNTFSDNAAFSMASLTASINLLPSKPGRLGELDLFPTKPITTRTVLIDEKYGQLSLLPTLPPGSPGTKADRGTRKVRILTVPHIPYDDLILAESVSGVRQFGTEGTPVNMVGYINDRLQEMKAKHEVTLERLRMGALKGQILDADDTVIYDLFKEFLIKQTKIDFKLGIATTNVKTKCLEVKRHIENNVSGQQFTEVRSICGPTFFDRLTGHPMVLDAYDRWQNGRAKRDDMRKEFHFGGVIFEEYGPNTALDSTGTARTFMTDDEAVAVPLGLADKTFQTAIAPADFVEAVNTPGQLFYARQTATKFDRGIQIHTQSNPLPLCCRPTLLVNLYSSN